MKIIIDGRLLSKKPTGISRYTLELIKSYQLKYDRDDIFVLVNTNFQDTSFNTIVTSLKPYNLWHFIQFYLYIKRLKVDIYHSAFYSGLLFKLRNTIQILTVHDLMFYIVPGFFSVNKVMNWLAKYYYYYLVNSSLKTADIIISVSNTTADDLRKIFNLESEVVGEGVSNLLEDDVVDSVDVLTKYDLKCSQYFLYVGNNRPHKNLDFLIRSFEASLSPHRLVLVGFKNDELNSRSIIVLNDVPDNDLSQLYQHSLAFIFPSLYEGFGLPVLEAINNKCVIFCSNEGSLSEFKFNSLRFFNPRNSSELITLIEQADMFSFDPSDLDELSKYDWQFMFNKYHRLLISYLKKTN